MPRFSLLLFLLGVSVCGAASPAALNKHHLPKGFVFELAAGPPEVVFPMFAALDDPAAFASPSRPVWIYTPRSAPERRNAPQPLPSESPPVRCPDTGSGLLEPPTGQLILGTDKRGPVFALYEDDSGERLIVFYGYAIIEIVNHNREDPACKLLLGRLCNAGVKLKGSVRELRGRS